MFNDSIINQLVGRYKSPKFKDRTKFLFEDLIESIISQQLSSKAANTIFKRFKKLSDEKVIEELVKLKGVGRWTAEMILIFTLKRPDVFSIGDLGLKKAIKKLYKRSFQHSVISRA